MSNFCIRQSDHGITLAKGTSPYVVTTHNHHAFPLEVSRYLTDTFITPELTEQYLALRKAEADAVTARTSWIKQLAQDLTPAVDSFLDNFPTTHPEVFL